MKKEEIDELISNLAEEKFSEVFSEEFIQKMEDGTLSEQEIQKLIILIVYCFNRVESANQYCTK